MKSKLERRDDGWWIVDRRSENHGPYKTRDEADDDRRGLERFWLNRYDAEWATCCGVPAAHAAVGEDELPGESAVFDDGDPADEGDDLLA